MRHTRFLTLLTLISLVPALAATASAQAPDRRQLEFFEKKIRPVLIKSCYKCHSATGKLAFDNYNGHWGEQKELDRFIQGYAVEKAKIEARKKGHSVIEQPLENGFIKLTVSVGGAV